jgi:2-phospho-L-lactate guanylyltransferase
MSTEQATVADYDPATRTGRLLRDDGVPLTFGPGTLDPAVRLLRRGQRVTLRLSSDEAAVVTSLTLATLPLP